jgi:transposase
MYVTNYCCGNPTRNTPQATWLTPWQARQPRRADYRNRNVIELRYCNIKRWRGLATRYDKHAVIYRTAVALNAVVAWTKTLSDTP